MEKELNHIAFIPDGNRRWAKEKHLPSLEGHRRGYQKFKEVMGWCAEEKIRHLSFWGFSTENWKRSKEEVGYLMDLFLSLLIHELDELNHAEVRIFVIGRRTDLSDKLIKAIENAENVTRENQKLNLYICFNYGGRAEIISAMKSMIHQSKDPDDIDEAFVERFLWSGNIPDIDLMIRTSGEQRLSGFMPWRGAYSELYFLDEYWPNIQREHILQAIDWFQKRERRFGGDAKKLK